MQLLTEEIRETMRNASWIRRMFEKGRELKERHGAEKVFDFSLGNPDLPPPAEARQALLELAEAVTRPMALGYPPNGGLPEFRVRLAETLSRQQRSRLNGSHVIATCGAAGALTSLFRAILEPGDEVVCPAPYFVEYGAYCAHFGGKLRSVPARPPDFQLDVRAIANAITERTRVLLINSPNNPTGCVYGQPVLDQVAELLRDVNERRERPLFLVSDEPYRFLCYDGVETPPVLPLSPFAVVVGSFSKSLSLAGERVGYLAVNPAMQQAEMLINAVTMTSRTLGFVNAPLLGQRLALSLLNSGIDISLYNERRLAMAEVLRAAGIEFSMPQGAFYFFPAAPGGDDKLFVERLLEQSILAVPGAGFGFPGYFRLAFCVDQRIIENAAPGFQAAVAAMGG